MPVDPPVTVTLRDAFSPEYIAVIVGVPAETPVTLPRVPELVTVACAVLLLDHLALLVTIMKPVVLHVRVVDLSAQ